MKGMLSDPGYCHRLVAQTRWPDGTIRCPSCGSDNVGWLATRNVWSCRARHTAARFSVRSGTVFADSALGLDKWLQALWLFLENKDAVSSRQLQATLGVTQKTGWFMLRRLRLAMNTAACRNRLPEATLPEKDLSPAQFCAVLQAILAVPKTELDRLVFWAAVDSPRSNNPDAPGRKPAPGR